MNFKKIKAKAAKMAPCIEFSKCIAKTKQDGGGGITVVEHSANTASVAENLASLYRNMEFLRLWGKTLSATHDTGKISPGFQKKIAGNHLREACPELAEAQSSNYCGNHAEISEAAIREFLDEFLDDSSAGEIVGIHHGKRKAPLSNHAGIYGGKKWAEERLKFLEYMVSKYGELPRKNDIHGMEKAVLAGFVTISDWIASDEEFFPAESFCGKESMANAVNALSSCGFRKFDVIPGFSFEDVFGFKMRKPQKSLIEEVRKPGVYVLEAATGSGKTEAALYAAYKMLEQQFNNGVYFALPTKLTSDRIHARVQDFVDKICEVRTPVMLSHGSAWLNDEVMNLIRYGGEELAPGGSWFTPAKRTLLAPFGVGTVDQALMAVMNVKHYCIRTFGLAGKVVILDEVHSYDIYTGTLLDNLIEALREMDCTVIILSATLTGERKKSLLKLDIPENKSYPLITSVTESECRFAETAASVEKHIAVSFKYDSSLEDIAVFAVAKAEKGQCVLWVCNTVAAAQEAYKKVEALKKVDSFETGLLHSRFTVLRRREIENAWMDRLGKPDDKKPRPQGCVLIATQVVEQSVDIDADFLITELAPMDMLIQRFGRLWRHDRPSRPADRAEVLITTGPIYSADSKEGLIESLGKSNSKIYAPYVLWKTWFQLKKKTCIVIPAELRKLLEATYVKTADEPDFIAEFFDEMKVKAEKLRRTAGGALAGVSLPVSDDDEESAPTRYCDMPTVDCLIVRNIDSTGSEAELTLLDGSVIPVKADDKNYFFTKELHKNIVSVARYHFNKEDLKLPLFLKKHFYGEIALLVLENDGGLHLNGEATKLFYRDDLGIYIDADVKAEQKMKVVEYKSFDEGEWDYESCDW